MTFVVSDTLPPIATRIRREWSPFLTLGSPPSFPSPAPLSDSSEPEACCCRLLSASRIDTVGGRARLEEYNRAPIRSQLSPVRRPAFRACCAFSATVVKRRQAIKPPVLCGFGCDRGFRDPAPRGGTVRQVRGRQPLQDCPQRCGRRRHAPQSQIAVRVNPAGSNPAGCSPAWPQFGWLTDWAGRSGDRFDGDRRDAGALHVEFVGDAGRYIDQQRPADRAAIVDRRDHRAPIAQIGHPHQ
jgi:hypothetical protein